MTVKITAEMSLFCINSLGYLFEEMKKKLNASNRCVVKEEQRGEKAKRREEQFVEHISKFRCKTNSVI